MDIAGNNNARQLRKAKAKADRDKHEGTMEMQLHALKFPEWKREYRFAAVHVQWDCKPGAKNKGKGLRERLALNGLKDWKFDFAWPNVKIALEIEGAIGHGRHTKPAGYREDCIKYREAALIGWTVYRVTGDEVQRGEAVKFLTRAFKRYGIEVRVPNNPYRREPRTDDIS